LRYAELTWAGKGCRVVDLPQVARSDIEASINAFKENDFENMNIFANRSMADSIFGEDKRLVLPGFFMKELATVFGLLEVRGKEQTAFSTAKTIGVNYVSFLSRLLREKGFEESELWQKFHEVNLELRKFVMSTVEGQTYKEDPEFTRYAFEWLVNYLKKKKETLFNPRNLLLKGILNEMDRIFRVYGGVLLDTYTLSLVRALDRYYDYCRKAYIGSDGTLDKDTIAKTIFPYIERIHGLSSAPPETQASMVNETLWELVKGWREFFIEYMELPRPRVEIERGVELPEEAKRKITESVTKTLEKEVGVKKTPS